MEWPPGDWRWEIVENGLPSSRCNSSWPGIGFLESFVDILEYVLISYFTTRRWEMVESGWDGHTRTLILTRNLLFIFGTSCSWYLEYFVNILNLLLIFWISCWYLEYLMIFSSFSQPAVRSTVSFDLSKVMASGKVAFSEDSVLEISIIWHHLKICCFH